MDIHYLSITSDNKNSNIEIHFVDSKLCKEHFIELKDQGYSILDLSQVKKEADDVFDVRKRNSFILEQQRRFLDKKANKKVILIAHLDKVSSYRMRRAPREELLDEALSTRLFKYCKLIMYRF